MTPLFWVMINHFSRSWKLQVPLLDFFLLLLFFSRESRKEPTHFWGVFLATFDSFRAAQVHVEVPQHRPLQPARLDLQGGLVHEDDRLTRHVQCVWPRATLTLRPFSTPPQTAFMNPWLRNLLLRPPEEDKNMSRSDELPFKATGEQ